jgi:prolyl oligopeptidase
MNRFTASAAFLAGLLNITFLRAADPKITYPMSKRTDHVDVFHGTTVTDPYRWLEDDVRKSPEVKAWVEAQNKVTEAYLKAIPQREEILKRLTDLWNYEKYSAPVKLGGRYFYSRNDGLQNQAVLYTQDNLDSPGRVLLDPNKWTTDGTAALSGWSVSDDGKYLAYARSDAGSDWMTWRLLDIATGKQLDDELKWTKFTGASWTADSKGFHYSRYQEPQKGAEFQSTNKDQQVWYHRVGTAQADDHLVYQQPDHPDWGFQAEATEDGRYLVITIWKGTAHKYRVAYQDLKAEKTKPVDLITSFDDEYTFLGNDGPVFYFKTDLEAPRGRVIAIDVTKPERANWKEIIPQAKESLGQVSLVGNMFIAGYLKDAMSLVKVYGTDGKFVRDVTLAGIGSASGFAGRRSDTETFYIFTSFATPGTTYRYDLASGASKVYRKSAAKVNSDDYEVKQVFAKSKDGTKVPLFIAHKKGVKLDGSNPTLLYGYGGFSISLPPTFSIKNLAWMEMGGVYAQACMRGGGEYGEDWHQAGTKKKKQNVFDDYIACAEWLIAHKYTRTAKLAIHGGSNGGLLVGAVMTQRPELFGACLPAVGVMDMLRFHKFTAGRFWVDDYGSPEDADVFPALLAYSPYHNLKPGTKYPPTLITTGDTDDRVVPGHSFKFAAELQHDQAGPAPVLIRIETRAGHGGGKPTKLIIEETADQWAFLVKNLGMKVK